MPFFSRSKVPSRAKEVRNSPGRLAEKESPPPSVKKSATKRLVEKEPAPPSVKKSASKLKRLQSAYHDEIHGVWRCRNCGWNYPTPNPNAHVRREHKKHCQGSLKVQHWLGDARHGSQGSAEDVEDLRDADQESTFLERLDSSPNHPVAMLDTKGDDIRVLQRGSGDIKVRDPIVRDLNPIPEVGGKRSISPVKDDLEAPQLLDNEAGAQKKESSKELHKESEIQEVEEVRSYGEQKKSEQLDIATNEVDGSDPQSGDAHLKKLHAASARGLEKVPDMVDLISFIDDEPDQQKTGDHVLTEKVGVTDNESILVVGDDGVKQKGEAESEANFRTYEDALGEKAEVVNEVEESEPSLITDYDRLEKKTVVVESDPDLIVDDDLKQKTERVAEVEEREANHFVDDNSLKEKAVAVEEVQERKMDFTTNVDRLKEKSELVEAGKESEPPHVADKDLLKEVADVVEETAERKLGLPPDDIALEENTKLVQEFDKGELLPTAGDDILWEKSEVVEEMGTSEESEPTLVADNDLLKEVADVVEETAERKLGLPSDDIALEENTNLVQEFDKGKLLPTACDDILWEKSEVVEEMGTSEESPVANDEGHHRKSKGVRLQPYGAVENQTDLEDHFLKDDDVRCVSGEGELIRSSESAYGVHALTTEKGPEKEDLEVSDCDEHQPGLVTTTVYESFVSGVPVPTRQEVVPGMKLSEELELTKSSDQEGRRVVPSTSQTSRGLVKLTLAERNWDDWDAVVRRGYILTEYRISPPFQDSEDSGLATKTLKKSLTSQGQPDYLEHPNAETVDVSEPLEERSRTAGVVVDTEGVVELETESEAPGLMVDIVECDGVDNHLRRAKDTEGHHESSGQEEQPDASSVCAGASSAVPPITSLQVELLPGTLFEKMEPKGFDQEEGTNVVQITTVTPPRQTGQTSRLLSKLSPAETNWEDWEDIVRSYKFTEDRKSPSLQGTLSVGLPLSGVNDGTDIGNMSLPVKEKTVKPAGVLEHEAEIRASGLKVDIMEAESVERKFLEALSAPVEDHMRTAKDLEQKGFELGDNEGQADVMAILVRRPGVSVDPQTINGVEVAARNTEKLELIESLDQDEGVKVGLSTTIASDHGTRQTSRLLVGKLSSAERNWTDWEDVVRGDFMHIDGRPSLEKNDAGFSFSGDDQIFQGPSAAESGALGGQGKADAALQPGGIEPGSIGHTTAKSGDMNGEEKADAASEVENTFEDAGLSFSEDDKISQDQLEYLEVTNAESSGLSGQEKTDEVLEPKGILMCDTGIEPPLLETDDIKGHSLEDGKSIEVSNSSPLLAGADVPPQTSLEAEVPQKHLSEKLQTTYSGLDQEGRDVVDTGPTITKQENGQQSRGKVSWVWRSWYAPIVGRSSSPPLETRDDESPSEHQSGKPSTNLNGNILRAIDGPVSENIDVEGGGAGTLKEDDSGGFPSMGVQEKIQSFEMTKNADKLLPSRIKERSSKLPSFQQTQGAVGLVSLRGLGVKKPRTYEIEDAEVVLTPFQTIEEGSARQPVTIAQSKSEMGDRNAERPSPLLVQATRSFPDSQLDAKDESKEVRIRSFEEECLHDHEESSDIERMLLEQKTYDLICPVCGSLITSRIVVKKKTRRAGNRGGGHIPVEKESQVVRPQTLGGPDDPWSQVTGFTSCISYFIGS